MRSRRRSGRWRRRLSDRARPWAAFVLAGAAWGVVIARMFGRIGFEARPLSRFGRSSLFVYWIHVELVYGYATRFFYGRLSLAGALVAFAAFTAVMYCAVLLRDAIHSLYLRRRFNNSALALVLGEKTVEKAVGRPIQC